MYKDPHEVDALDVVLYVSAFAFIAWKVWPIIKANNIFMKNPPQRYAKSTQPKKYKMYSPFEALVLVVVGNIAGIYLFFSDHFSSKVFLTFFFSFCLLMSTFFYAYMEEDEFDWFPDFTFFKRVWMTNLFLPPIFLLIIYHQTASTDIFYYYLAMLAYGNGAGVAVMAALMLSVYSLSTKSWKNFKKKLYICVITEGALAVSLLAVAVVFRVFLMVFICWFVYALVLGTATWYYDMSPVIHSDESQEYAETVD